MGANVKAKGKLKPKNKNSTETKSSKDLTRTEPAKSDSNAEAIADKKLVKSSKQDLKTENDAKSQTASPASTLASRRPGTSIISKLLLLLFFVG